MMEKERDFYGVLHTLYIMLPMSITLSFTVFYNGFVSNAIDVCYFAP